ncbi:MAG TPA: PepSY domain-containing protein [Chloroflexia bacterium]|nr:PepSY domain-containing protein [Chloroflexia bacterium]
MTQRIAYMAAAGMAAFMVVLLAALGAYVVLHGQDAAAVGTAADNNTSALTAPLQNTAPQNSGETQEQPGSGDRDTSGDQSDANAEYPVSADQASAIALSIVEGTSLLQQPRLVDFQGRAAYEVQLSRGMVYVDASTGQVLYDGVTANTGRQRPRGHR